MSTAPVTTLMDEQIADIERSFAILSFGAPFNEPCLMPRNLPVSSLPCRIKCTFRGKRATVRARQ